MTENVSGQTEILTAEQRTVWGVNYQVGMDRDDLVDELAGPAATRPPVPEPVRRGTRAAHRVALRRLRRR
jgi:hypothetical protein